MILCTIIVYTSAIGGEELIVYGNDNLAQVFAQLCRILRLTIGCLM